MEAVLERRWGLDVHKKLSQKGDFPSAQACSFSFEIASKKSVVACVITPQGREIRTFRSMTKELLELADWLRVKEVSHVRSAT